MANNTILAIAVGAGLIGVALLLRAIIRGERIASEGWAALFALTGLITFTLGTTTSVMWPYGTEELAYGNIAFGEPAMGFGALLFFAAVYLWRTRSSEVTSGASVVKDGATRTDLTAQATHLIEGLKPVSIFVFFLGLGTAWIALAWVRFQMGAAPEFEPISGNFNQWPWLEAIFLGGLWGMVALGALLFPFALRDPEGKLMKAVIVLFLLSGLVFGAFGAMNMYTHIGMNYNLAHGTMHRW